MFSPHTFIYKHIIQAGSNFLLLLFQAKVYLQDQEVD